jgi:prepilin-type N-terminal cleavage/methylation domain-containing protein
MKHRLQNTSRFSRPRATRRSGFTLIELMVVLAIAAVVTSLTVGGYREMSDGNKRTSCQTNLTQIYQGLRLYANDEAGLYPPYKVNPAPPNEGIGLWALYTYPKDGSAGGSVMADVGVKPVGRYVRNPKVFHCPADVTPKDSTIDHENLYTNTTKNQFNPNYLSYQRADDNIQTYLPWRQTDSTQKTDTATQLSWKRQLALWVPDTNADSDTDPDIVAGAQPSDDTVVTWCVSHRYVRDYDNVLFLDGSVQIIPSVQDDAVLANCADDPLTERVGAKRLPKRDHCS